MKYAKSISTILDFITLIFIALRACEVTSWEWWQVLMPTFVGAFIIIVFVFGFAAGLADEEGI